MNRFIILATCFQLLLFPVSVFSQDNMKFKNANSKFNIRELVLPSEVKSLSKTSGSIYYSASVKGKALIPVHIWGAVQRSGLHFIPIDTSLVSGLSFAGGPNGTAELNEVKVTRMVGKELKDMSFSLEDGGDVESFSFKLEPGDTVFVPKDTFYQNRSYYTSLIGVVATVLSSILLYRQVRRIQ